MRSPSHLSVPISPHGQQPLPAGSLAPGSPSSCGAGPGTHLAPCSQPRMLLHWAFSSLCHLPGPIPAGPSPPRPALPAAAARGRREHQVRPSRLCPQPSGFPLPSLSPQRPAGPPGPSLAPPLPLAPSAPATWPPCCSCARLGSILPQALCTPSACIPDNLLEIPNSFTEHLVLPNPGKFI